MTYTEFYHALKKEGATEQDIIRLNEEGYESAVDAHKDMWESGAMPEIESLTQFTEFCYSIGREFVLENFGDLFALHDEQEETEE